MQNNDLQWSVYDGLLQSYRSHALASQSLLLAVGALLYSEYVLLVLTFVIAMIQVWFIWFRVIRARAIITDFHKFNTMYGFSSFINRDTGEEEENTARPLTEEVYLKNRAVRKRANEVLANREKQPKLKRNYRLTRIKIDILLPITNTILWAAIVLVRTIERCGAL